MAGKLIIPFLFLIINQANSASLIETSYEYVMNFGKTIAPSLMEIWGCMGEAEAWSCAKEKAGKILDAWGEQVDSERRSWQEAADAEVAASGRSFKELPSKIGEDVESSLNSVAEVIHHGIARALQSRKHHEDSGSTITISAATEKKKKKKQKPPKIHLIHPVMMPLRKAHKEEMKGRSFPNGRQTWVIGETEHFVDVEGVKTDKDVKRDDVAKERRLDEEVKSDGVDAGREDKDLNVGVNEWGDSVGVRTGRGVMGDLWRMGEEALDLMADTALEAETKDNGVQDKSSFEEQRGKKKKKKKAILKLLILGAVLKAKIGTLLQILSFKLQVKFFIVALLGLAINLARLWIDLKNKHNHQPQKSIGSSTDPNRHQRMCAEETGSFIPLDNNANTLSQVIYYEHAQHQHHYDHEDEHESQGWGPWSRSMEPEETDLEVDVDLQNSPYRGQERNPHPPFLRPVNA